MLVRFDTDHEKHTIVGGLADAVPLHGADIVERLQSRIGYPDGLAMSMVVEHLRFRSLWYLEERFAGRDSLFPFHQVLIDWARRILAIPLGLNRLFREHEFKRLGELVARAELARPDPRRGGAGG